MRGINNMASKFIMACECPICGKVCKDNGLTVDLTAEENVVTLNNFSHTYWHCKDCDIDFGTEDLSNAVEEF